MPAGRYASSRQFSSDPRTAGPRVHTGGRMARRVVSAFASAAATGRPCPAAAAIPRRERGARRYRLAGTGVFAAIFRNGIRRDGAFVQLIAVPARKAPGRVGFVIGRKAFQRAVERNRVRRVLRAIVAAARPEIERFDVIVRIKRGCPRAEIRSLAAEAEQLLATLTAEPTASAGR